MVAGSLVAGIGGSLLLTSPASALSPTSYGWWSRTNTGVFTGNPPPDVPAHGIYVQSAPDGPVAIGAVEYRISPGASAHNLVLDIAGTPVITSAPIACLATTQFQNIENGPWSSAPTYDCATKVTGAVNATQTQVQFSVASLIRNSTVDAVILAGGQIDRIAFSQPGATSLETVPVTPPGASATNTSGDAAKGPAAPAASAPQLIAPGLVSSSPGAGAVPIAPALAAPAAGGPVAGIPTNRASSSVSGSDRRAVGEGVGLTLLVGLIVYWSDGFGAFGVRSALAARSTQRQGPARVIQRASFGFGDVGGDAI